MSEIEERILEKIRRLEIEEAKTLGQLSVVQDKLELLVLGVAASHIMGATATDIIESEIRDINEELMATELSLENCHNQYQSCVEELSQCALIVREYEELAQQCTAKKLEVKDNASRRDGE